MNDAPTIKHRVRSLSLYCFVAVGGMTFTSCQLTGDGQVKEHAPAAEPAEAVAAVERVLTAELMVRGVSCASCSVGIRRELKRLSGVEAIRAGDDASHVLVDFSPGTLTPEALVEAVNAAGYETEVLIRAHEIEG